MRKILIVKVLANLLTTKVLQNILNLLISINRQQKIIM